MMNRLQYKSGSDREEYLKIAQKIPKLTSADIMEDTTMRLVFVTASPVLTNEVKQYYASLKQQLASHLTNVEKGDGAREEEDKCEADDGQKRLLTFLEMKEREIMQEDTLEHQLKLPESYNSLKARHFPLFLTVQRLVYMMDAALGRSFFTRSHDGKIIGMETSLGWHNEDQGVFMINQDFKQTEETRKNLQKFELNILTGVESTISDDDKNGGADQLGLFTIDKHQPLNMEINAQKAEVD